MVTSLFQTKNNKILSDEAETGRFIFILNGDELYGVSFGEFAGSECETPCGVML